MIIYLMVGLSSCRTVRTPRSVGPMDCGSIIASIKREKPVFNNENRIFKLA